ncbi:MAG: YihY/virulence factor BrkB family protein, partial [Treponema sp.]|nr:YihY/virulence factor BrkB family protein [Treponema sp.]
NFFVQNNLNTYAAACAYGFLFSFIPVVMMVLAILIQFLHASPETITTLLNFGKSFDGIFSLQSVIDSISAVNRISWVEIVLGLFIFWIARNFFFSVMQSIRRIFRKAVPARPVFYQVIGFAGEVLLVVASAVFIFFIISMRTLTRLSLMEQIQTQFPLIFTTFSRILLATVPYALIFIFEAVVLKVVSGINPEWKVCFTASGLCTLIFWIVVQFLNMFLDYNKYNIVYGVLGNLIVLLFEVYIFFILFLFFAQFIFVMEFFDILLLGELYLLPARDETGPIPTLKRVLFIRPDYLIQKNANIVHYKAGDTIFTVGDTSDDAYYIIKGSIVITKENSLSHFDKGAFFGELACVINKPRTFSAQADTDTDLVIIQGETFLNLLKQNPKVSIKALSQISNYLSEVYGRREGFLL